MLATACTELDSETAAYIGLILTPPGGFAPLATAARSGEPATSGVSFRYGRISQEAEDAINNFGLTADFGSGTSRLGLTAGAATCSGCDPVIMVGADWTTSILRRPVPDGSVGLGLTAAVGAGFPTDDESDGFAMSGSLGLPMSMVAGSADRLRVIPFITPAIGFGKVTGEGGASDVRVMVGGGIGVFAANGLGVSTGVQKVFVEGGKAVLGVSVTLAGRKR